MSKTGQNICDSVKYHKASLTNKGALSVRSGEYTGRCPSAKKTVRDDLTENTVDWTANESMDQEGQAEFDQAQFDAGVRSQSFRDMQDTNDDRGFIDTTRSNLIKGLGPDSKSQVSLLYKNGRPIRATSVVISTQHDDDLEQAEVREIVRPFVEQTLPKGWMCPENEFYVNPTGRFVVGGPDGDAGLTGRKIIVDTYGGAAPHGGGAFSGKDPSKVDRSAAYAARWLAKNVVAAGLAEKCTIQLSYAIGIAKPLSVYINTHGTGNVSEVKLSEYIQTQIDLSPRGIRERLELNESIYARTAAYGHFGREPELDGGFTWEKLDLVQEFQSF